LYFGHRLALLPVAMLTTENSFGILQSS